MVGVWVPLVTPFRDGLVDLKSYRRLIEHYVAQGVSGLFPLGTTGEAPTLDDAETDALLAETVEAVAGRVPVFAGIGGNATHKVIRTIRRVERHGFPGIVSVCPYYNRPGQDGLRAHFTAISQATDRRILIYNIPYRTSVNLGNETVMRLAELENVVGIKDSAGNITQSLELLANKPAGFSVLTGEDHLFFPLMCSGADGGILASSHVATDRFVDIARLVAANDHQAARTIWTPLQQLIARLFEEANPMPLKYCLWRQGLIASPECRLPLTAVSAGLREDLDAWMARNALLPA
ncbi:MAG: 4-hydroxy-tetrahydrodipicolinate synthase [Tardiphaga sp.]|jgi:4-hydroxy-tetrahydrodipicolinate synthase|nr:4-hydroxy-tetrahydrodipicolinate synthase [Tardiphaga sp.]